MPAPPSQLSSGLTCWPGAITPTLVTRCSPGASRALRERWLRLLGEREDRPQDREPRAEQQREQRPLLAAWGSSASQNLSFSGAMAALPVANDEDVGALARRELWVSIDTATTSPPSRSNSSSASTIGCLADVGEEIFLADEAASLEGAQQREARLRPQLHRPIDLLDAQLAGRLARRPWRRASPSTRARDSAHDRRLWREPAASAWRSVRSTMTIVSAGMSTRFRTSV